MVPSETARDGAGTRKSRRHGSPRAVFLDRRIHQCDCLAGESRHAHVSSHSVGIPTTTRGRSWFVRSPKVAQLACSEDCTNADWKPLPRAVGSNRHSCAAVHRPRDVARFAARSASRMLARSRAYNPNTHGHRCCQSSGMLAADASRRSA